MGKKKTNEVGITDYLFTIHSTFPHPERNLIFHNIPYSSLVPQGKLSLNSNSRIQGKNRPKGNRPFLSLSQKISPKPVRYDRAVITGLGSGTGMRHNLG